MKLGVFGGTFDPPHIGHQILASEAAWQLGLDRILWVITTNPPHKNQSDITPIEHRIKMVEFAIENNSKFSLSRIDIDRDPPYFAVDTVNMFKQNAPKDDFFYLMGLDSLNDLVSWHEPSEFVNSCDGIVVMQRSGEELNLSSVEADFPGIREKLHLLLTPIIEVSSSDIRERVNNKVEYRYFLPLKVFTYIQQNHLYSG